MAYSILIVDDHPIVRTGIKASLKDLALATHEASNGQEALLQLKTNDAIQLVILDIHMPIMDGIDTAYTMRKNFPTVKTIIHSRCENPHLIKQLLHIGVNGFHCKSDPNLVHAVEAVMRGQFYVSPEIQSKVLTVEKKMALKPIQFSATELTILSLCASGHTSTVIGDKLGLQPGSIDTYRKRLVKRFNANNITEVVDFAHRIGKL